MTSDVLKLKNFPMDKKVYEFVSQKTNDPIVERKVCEVSWEEFPIYESDLEFYEKISPIFDWKKYSIPSPKLSPSERERRRMAFRNERKLYRRTCDATGKSIISIYSPDKPYKIYEQNERWSDRWDPLDYGIGFEFNKNFFEQFDKLMKTVPQMSLTNFNNENSDYCNYLNDSKNCYLASASWFLEDSMYCNWSYEGKSIVDCGFCFKWENSYMNVSCEDFYGSMYCRDCKQVTNCYFCVDCYNCQNCIGCTNLVGKNYYIFNKQYTKEEFESKKSELLKNKENLFAKLNELENSSIHWSTKKTNSENCFGSNIKNSKNSVFCYEIEDVDNARYCREVMQHKNIMDVNNNGYSELEYEIMWFGYNNKVAFTIYSAECVNVFYSAYCQYSKNLFGCVGLRNKEYCIFNKQYTKEEYETLVPKIIKHMETTWERWEFFPIRLSPWGYNETHANEYYPMIKEECLSLWYKRMDQEYPINIPSGIQTLNAVDLPPIESVDDDMLNKAIICSTSNKPYRIVKQELEFYRKHNLELPKEHPDLRHKERMSHRVGIKLYLRNCDQTWEEILSIYPQEVPFKVYSEGAYTQEIYW